LCGDGRPALPSRAKLGGCRNCDNSEFSLAARNGPYDNKRLRPRCNRVWQRCVRRFMRQIFLAGEEAQKRPALERVVIADRAAQHRILSLKRIQHGALRGRAINFDHHLAPDMGQGPEVLWK